MSRLDTRAIIYLFSGNSAILSFVVGGGGGGLDLFSKWMFLNGILLGAYRETEIKENTLHPLLWGRKTTNLSLSGFLCLSADEAGC